MKRDTLFLRIILVLSILGLVTSIYLVQNHYAPPSEGSLCDFGEAVSCSLVNTSVYSMLFNVPVALFGALWFIILGFMAYKAQKDTFLRKPVLWWSWLGIAFVVYLVIAEIILQSICPFCTIVHIFVIAIFVLAILINKKTSTKKGKKSTKKTKKSTKDAKKLKVWATWIIVIMALPLLLFNLPGGSHENHDQVAKCITEKGVNMYGSFKCGICAKTRSMFGNSFDYINEIECHPQGEHSEWELCQDKGIEGTPTWILEPNGEEVKRHTGFMSIEELVEFAGCEE